MLTRGNGVGLHLASGLRWAVALTGLVAFVGCLPKQDVSIIEHAVWSDDNETVLQARADLQVPVDLLEQFGPIGDPVSLMLVVGTFGLLSSGDLAWEELHPDLTTSGEVLRWTGLNDDRGVWNMRPDYWLRSRGIAVGMGTRLIEYEDGHTEYVDEGIPVACLLDVDRVVRTDLVTPDETLYELLGVPLDEVPPDERYYLDTEAMSAIPSPDGSTVAVSFFVFSGNFVEFISFFDTESGGFIRAVNLSSLLSPNYPAGLVSPLASERQGEEGDMEYYDPLMTNFIWSKDSQSVYVLEVACSEESCATVPERAWLVPVDPDVAPTTVSKAPARAVPTRGGPVSDTGLGLAVNMSADGFTSTLSLVPQDDWVAFDEIPLIPVEQVTYLWSNQQ